jgi:cell wall-associated NlpC family hydrolase
MKVKALLLAAALLAAPVAVAAPAFAAPAAATCGSPATSNPHTCAQAVTWAKNHVGVTSSDYDHRCDHVVALAYGRSASGHNSAAAHWSAMPSQYKHSGTTVPAGGLAFFSIPNSTAGHVMISIGGGKFVSNDIVAAGKLSETTIATIESKWGGHYLGWSNPWF